MSKKRVVITGIGAVTPFGVGAQKMWDNLKEGKSGIKKLEYVDTSLHVVHIGGEVKDFKPEEYIDPKDAVRMDRYIHFAMVAADEAMKDAGLAGKDFEDPYRVGVMVSSAAGGFHTFENNHHLMLKRGYPKCSPFCVPNIIADMGCGRISIKYGAKGINKAVLTACATAAHSIGDAFRSIQWGDADVMVAGGTEATICDVGLGAFSAARTLSKRNDEPERASRPYDVDRDGFVMSEGAGVLVLEEYEHAKKRGAKIYAEIVGYGQTGDAYDVVAPAPDGSGAIKAMELALADAGMKPSEVQYVNTHGTSTGLGDKAESHAVAKVFGDKHENPGLFVTSTKSMHGHMLGATGAAEAIVCVKTLTDNVVPPTINLDNQDPEVAELNYTPYKAVNAEVNAALSNSFGFGGQNASLVFKAV